METISKHFMDVKMIGNNQHGLPYFTNLKSYFKYLLTLVNLADLVNDGRAADIACLDCRKVFDTVSQEILIE